MVNQVNARRPRKNTKDRITIDALAYYAPFFKMGIDAEENILAGGLTPAEKNLYETQAKLKNLVVRKIMALSGPLITSELNKIISSSHLPYSDDLFDILYYSGMAGLAKGLAHFDESKLKASATNYLFQWFTVYAKRELSILEAPFGIAPSRFQKYKKISAVRKKLTAEYDRDVTNQEIFDYFQSGKADIKNLNGRVGSYDKPSQANKNITLELIEEQEEFERIFMNVELLDPLEDYSSEIRFSRNDDESFAETAFGVFIDRYNVTMKAKVVLLSELSSTQITDEESFIASNMDSGEYKELATAWRTLIKDQNGPFYEFLKDSSNDNFTQFDINSTMKFIENEALANSYAKYSVLFKENER